MLVHVFDTLWVEEEGTTFFPDFLRRATKATSIENVRRDGEYLVIEGIKKKKKKEFTVEWPSGILYQKLWRTHSKRTLPVIWKMCRYYSGVEDVASRMLRSYLKKEHGVVLEHTPFCLEPTGVLSTSCQASKTTFPDELDPDHVKITVDKQSADVILLPHRGVARTLMLLLKEFL